jgi:hypothetical protein
MYIIQSMGERNTGQAPGKVVSLSDLRVSLIQIIVDIKKKI